MPYAPLTPATLDRLTRRILLAGPPNAGKTVSLPTFPRPLGVISCPGELGVASLFQAKGGQLPDDVQAWQWTMVDVSKPVDWGELVRETRATVAEVLGSKRFQTVAVDGLHKYYWCVLNEVCGGVLAKGDTLDEHRLDGRKVYPQAAARFFHDLRGWLQADVPYFIATVWIGRDREDPDNPKSQSHIFPALPGQAGQDVVGEFSMVLYAEREGTGGAARYLWRTKPDGRIWGVGLKLPLEIAARVPQTVPQRWEELAKWLG